MSEIVESNDIEVKKTRGRPKKDSIPAVPINNFEGIEPFPKRARGRPKVENPCLPGKPKAGKQYFRDYYATKLKNCLISCPKCNTMIEKINLSNHLKTALCAKIANYFLAV